MALSRITGNKAVVFLKDLYRSMSEHDVFTGAAALAYYFFLALFPALIFLLSLIPFLPFAPDLYNYLMTVIRGALPEEGAEVLSRTVAEVTVQRRGGLVSLGGLLTLWAASAGTYAAMRQLNLEDGIRESRPFWKVRGISILLTLALSVLILVAFVLMIFGGILSAWIIKTLNLDPALMVTSTVLQWVIAIAAILTGFALIYNFGPDVKKRFRFLSPGATSGAVVVLLASALFRIYVQSFANYSVTYGSIGAVIILMLWLYLMALVMLVGNEINKVAERRGSERREPASTETLGYSHT